MDTTISVSIDGETYAGQLGTIKSTRLGIEDHGVMTVMLDINFGGSGVGVGGFVLDKPGDHGREGTAYGLDQIIRILEVVGVERWEALPGKSVVVLFEGESAWGGRSVGIANTMTGKSLVLAKHADLWRQKAGE